MGSVEGPRCVGTHRGGEERETPHSEGLVLLTAARSCEAWCCQAVCLGRSLQAWLWAQLGKKGCCLGVSSTSHVLSLSHPLMSPFCAAVWPGSLGATRTGPALPAAPRLPTAPLLPLLAWRGKQTS